MSRINAPKIEYAVLQPKRAISVCATVGVIIAPMPIPNIVKPRARPRNLSNQCATKDLYGIGPTPPTQQPKRK